MKLVQKNPRPLEWAGIESPKIRIWHATKFGSHNEIRSVRWRWFRCQESLAAQLNATVLIDIDHLHLDRLANLHVLKNILDKAVSELGDVAHAVGAWHQLHECAELFDRDNFAFEHGANLDLGAKRFDFQFGLRRFGRVGTRDEHGSVFFHVDLRAGSLLKRADCFSAWTNELTDLLWINLDLGDAWSELRHLGAWFGDDGFNLVDELQTTFTRLREDDRDFLKAKSAFTTIAS